MPKFLSTNELYRLFQRELPEDVYVDGPATAGYSPASLYAKATVLEKVYSNLQRIYDNYFPGYADERQDDWEIKVFGAKLDATLTLAERRARVIAKLQKQPTITLWEILTLVAGYLPEGVFVQIAENGCSGGPWRLDVSRLGVDTALGIDPYTAGYPASCSSLIRDGWILGLSRLGLDTALTGTKNWNQVALAQLQAYGYQIRIFNYALAGDTLTQMLQEISRAEPARSGRILRQNADLNDFGLVIPVTNVDQFSSVNCITRDPLSTTGYSGRKTA